MFLFMCFGLLGCLRQFGETRTKPANGEMFRKKKKKTKASDGVISFRIEEHCIFGPKRSKHMAQHPKDRFVESENISQHMGAVGNFVVSDVPYLFSYVFFKYPKRCFSTWLLDM